MATYLPRASTRSLSSSAQFRCNAKLEVSIRSCSHRLILYAESSRPRSLTVLEILRKNAKEPTVPKNPMAAPEPKMPTPTHIPTSELTRYFPLSQTRKEQLVTLPSQLQTPVRQRQRTAKGQITVQDESDRGKQPKDAHSTGGRMIRGYIEHVFYVTGDGKHRVVFVEKELPQKGRQKKEKNEHRSTKKSAAVRLLFGEDEDEEENATDSEAEEEGAIDLGDTDDEDDDEEEENSANEQNAKSAQGYELDGFIVDGSESEESGEDGNDSGESSVNEEESDDDAEKEEEVAPPDQEKQVPIEKKCTEPATPQTDKEDEDMMDASLSTHRCADEAEQYLMEIVQESKTRKRPATETKMSPRKNAKTAISAQTLATAKQVATLLPETVRSLMSSFRANVGPTKPDDDTDDGAEEAKEEKKVTRAQVLQVKEGTKHRLLGIFPTTCPLVIMDIIINKEDDKCVAVKAVHRTWDGDLTKKKLIAGLTTLKLWNQWRGVKAFHPIGGKIADPLTRDGISRVTDAQYAWTCAGALNDDEEMSLCKVIGIQTYTNMCSRRSAAALLLENVRSDPPSILFATEKVPVLASFTGLRRITYSDFLNMDSAQPDGIISGAWTLFRKATIALERYGDTMTPIPRETPAEAVNYLRGKSYAVTVDKCIALRSAYFAEKKLAERIVFMYSWDPAPLPPDAGANARAKILGELRADIREAVEATENTALLVVVAPEEASLFLVSALSKLHAKVEIVVGCFDAGTKLMIPTAFRLPTEVHVAAEIHSFIRAVSISGPLIVILTDVHCAGSVVLEKVLKAVPPHCRVALVGEEFIAAQMPTHPDLGKPFLALCAAPIPTRVYVGSQINKAGPELAMDVIVADPCDIWNILDQHEHVECVTDPMLLQERQFDVLLFSTWQPGGGRKPVDVFDRGDVVMVRSAGIPQAAGKLVGVKMDYDDMFSSALCVHQPFERRCREYDLEGHSCGSRPAEIVVDLDNSGYANKHVQLVNTTRKPLAHVDGTCVRYVPPFKVSSVCLVVDEKTVLGDICMTAKLATDKLFLCGKRSDIVGAAGRKLRSHSVLGYILEHVNGSV